MGGYFTVPANISVQQTKDIQQTQEMLAHEAVPTHHLVEPPPFYADSSVWIAFIGLLTALVTAYFGRHRIVDVGKKVVRRKKQEK